MPDTLEHAIRQDCLKSLQLTLSLSQRLSGQRIAVIGGTGFIGTWLAETVATLNDELNCRVRVDLLGRTISQWAVARPHLSRREEIQLQQIDVRSPFELARDVTLVVYAAGVADPRVHASDPLRVQETSLQGMSHTLTAASRLELLQRFVNISSGLVLGGDAQQHALREKDIGVLDFTRAHNVYPESRRAAENLVSIFSSQYRLPVSTARAFTFIGPYQPLDAPWALSNFMRDALLGNDIRLHGDGATRRSYLYGSDAAVWLLKMLVDGRDGEVYNLGGSQAASHEDVATMVADRTLPRPQLVYKSQPTATGRRHDFFPDLQHTQSALELKQAFAIQAAIDRALHWHATHLGVVRRLLKGHDTL